MQTALAAFAAWLVSATPSWAQNCVITGSTNYGTIIQNCTVVGPTKLTFEPTIAAELLSKLPPGNPVQLVSVGSANDHSVADQYGDFLQSRGFKILKRDRIGMLSPPPDHPITIITTEPNIIIMIDPSAR